METFILALVIGLLAGGAADFMLNKQRAEARKKRLRAKKHARQRSILERFRVEVKNNTVRLKKEEKRLALSKKLAPIDLLFKNHGKRLHKLSDKDLMALLNDFYKELIALLAMNEAYIVFAEKNITENDDLNDESVNRFYKYMTNAILHNISALHEKGASIVALIEDKLQKS